MMTYALHCGDCLAVLPTLQAGSVDCVIADVPYGTTACAWDTVIPFAPMWAGIEHAIKPRAAVVLFGSQPFTSALVMSKPGWFKYAWVWDKVNHANFLSIKTQPLKTHEDVLIFYGESATYNCQKSVGAMRLFGKASVSISAHHSPMQVAESLGIGYPKSIIRFPKPNNLTDGGLHPTQKPVALLRYLIRTYTNPGDTVLDFTMGSGTTIVAAILEGRNAIGIELDEQYFAIAQKRCADAAAQPLLLPIHAPVATVTQPDLLGAPA